MTAPHAATALGRGRQIRQIRRAGPRADRDAARSEPCRLGQSSIGTVEPEIHQRRLRDDRVAAGRHIEKGEAAVAIDDGRGCLGAEAEPLAAGRHQSKRHVLDGAGRALHTARDARRGDWANLKIDVRAARAVSDLDRIRGAEAGRARKVDRRIRARLPVLCRRRHAKVRDREPMCVRHRDHGRANPRWTSAAPRVSARIELADRQARHAIRHGREYRGLHRK